MQLNAWNPQDAILGPSRWGMQSVYALRMHPHRLTVMNLYHMCRLCAMCRCCYAQSQQYESCLTAAVKALYLEVRLAGLPVVCNPLEVALPLPLGLITAVAGAVILTLLRLMPFLTTCATLVVSVRGPEGCLGEHAVRCSWVMLVPQASSYLDLQYANDCCQAAQGNITGLGTLQSCT